MQSFRRLLQTTFFVAFSLSSALVWGHATLLSSMPTAMAQLDKAPTEITLKFNANIEGVFSTIVVLDAAQHQVTDAKAHLDKADQSTFRLGLPVLASGTYLVRWTAVTDDGHKQKGEFSFTVK